MILVTTMLVSMQVPSTPEEIERLPPTVAGDLVLAGLEHGPIESVVRQPAYPMAPPGLVILEFVERPVALEGGCSRRRWGLHFIARPDGSTVELSPPSDSSEVALLPSGTCSEARYVGSSGVGPSEGLAALRHLDAIRLPESRVRFSCTDTTSSHLCAS